MSYQPKTINGNLLTSDEPVIAHGCNAQGHMTGGIAAQIAEKYPVVEMANKAAVRAGLFAPGTCQYTQPYYNGPVVFNLATQDQPGPDARLEWVYLAFRNLAEQCVKLSITRVAIPQIGCGIGGLNWSDVKFMIGQALLPTQERGFNLEIVVYLFDPREAS